jgi:putative oxidoreductase
MIALFKLMQLGSKYHRDWLIILRVGLGILLFTKGIFFISNTVQLEGILANTKHIELYASWFAFVIAWAHIFGGLFIVMGLFTRLFCLIQLPIVLVALSMSVFYHILTGYALFEIIVGTVLLVFFAIEGGGKLSMDGYYIFRKNEDLRISEHKKQWQAANE